MSNWEPWFKGFIQVGVFGVMAGLGHFIGLDVINCFVTLCTAGFVALFVAFLCSIASV